MTNAHDKHARQDVDHDADHDVDHDVDQAGRTAIRTESHTEIPDMNALDDTRAGRIVQSLVVGALYAVPDFAKSKLAKFIGFSSVALGGVGLIGIANARRDDSEDLQEVRNAAEVSAEDTAADSKADDFFNSPAKSYGFLASVLGLFGLSLWGEVKLNSWMARKMREHGIKYPHSILGAIAAVLAFASFEYDNASRRNLKNS